ncbi:hypothetical protein V6N12_061575 [Hibiscus sabdariffa]|uniref:Amine oxidase domain-containing protein n=1 Tax=Hibiscus sabdariffa TaxID=183260 RepID=A0ABR2DXG1_9ROSI
MISANQVQFHAFQYPLFFLGLCHFAEAKIHTETLPFVGTIFRIMKVAVVGGGISGLVSAYVLAKQGADVVLYEKEGYLGGHSKTLCIDGVDLDLGFMVFNRVTYPNMMEFFESLGIDMEPSDMSFSVSLDQGRGCEWGSRNGFSSLFAQKSNLFNPYFWQMIREIIKFKNDVISYLELLENNPDIDRNETLGQFLTSRGYSELFQKAYLVPVCGSIWSCPTERVMDFSAFSILSFCRNHHLLQLFGRPQWMTVRSRSHRYVNKVREELENRGCQIRTGCEVHSVLSDEEGCTVVCENESRESFHGCIMAVHAPDAWRLLGNQATYDESTVLGAFLYVYSDIYLHRDKKLMPKNPAAWSAWNFLGSTDKNVCLTYWLNVLQNLGETGIPFLWLQLKLLLSFDRIQGKRGIWFCGAYQGYGFHEDGLKAGMIAANSLLGKRCNILSNPKHMIPQSFYINRLRDVMTEADLGLADSYINGDFSFVDKRDGLLNLVMILIGNRDLISSNSKLSKKRGWWTPLLLTAGLTSAKYFFKHVLRQNTLTQARRNISRHYDLLRGYDL